MDLYILLTKTTYSYSDTMNELRVFTNYEDLIKFCREETLKEINGAYLKIDDDVVEELGKEYVMINESGDKLIYKEPPDMEEINEILENLFESDSDSSYCYEFYEGVYGNNVEMN